MKSAKNKKIIAKKSAKKPAAKARRPVRKAGASSTVTAAAEKATALQPGATKTVASIGDRPAAVKKVIKNATMASPAALAKTKATAKPSAAVSAPKPSSVVRKRTAPVKAEVPVRRAASAPKTLVSGNLVTAPAPVSGHVAKKIAPPTPRKADIPAILFEGDEPALPPPSGPGQRYLLAPLTPLAGVATPEVPARLPDSYGTGRLLLTARDPHWLYAHWDFSHEQQIAHNKASRDGHLVLRIFKGHPGGAPFQEIALHPESRSWFVHVGIGGTEFHADLGYLARDGSWHGVSSSAGTFTPPETLSEDASVRFETLPTGVKFEELVELVKTAVSENVPLMEALLHLRAAEESRREAASQPPPQSPSALPPVLVETLTWYLALQQQGGRPSIEWTPEREQALAQMISMDSVRRVWMGSLEITELIRRQLPLGISSGEAPLFSRPGAVAGVGVTGGAARAISSPLGGVEQPRGFWFNVNAELIIYGATEPNAKVTIGGRRIKLRADGSFSYRFALPDGDYELPAVAVAADDAESRSAKLNFSRATEYRGEVAAHPQDAALKAPTVENL